jgi:hypothetical protein
LVTISKQDASKNPVYVKFGDVPADLKEKEKSESWASVFNKNECITRIPDVANYYITGGNVIIVEPVSSTIADVVLFIYSSCIASVLLQRDVILMHVSGVFTGEKEVLLFAAPSGTGKSTTATMLRQKGYPVFTDDTALLFIENGKCYARASYPETRMWQDVTDIQQVYDGSEGRRIRNKIDKYAFSFAESFVTEKVEIKGIVFLEAEGEEIKLENLTKIEIWQLLTDNVYGIRFINGMKKDKLVFAYMSSLANILPAWKAIRPATARSFEEFSAVIEQEVIMNLRNV